MMNEPRGLLSATESLCPQCLQRIPAFYTQGSEGVELVKACPQHGAFSTPVWRGELPFETWVRNKIPAHIEHPQTVMRRGCPYDCGICPEHRQHTCTALIEVTQRCNLACAYCFASSLKDRRGDLSLEHIETLYRGLLQAGGPYNIQLSGGEPTVRDDLPEIVALGRSLGFDFIQLNTNGLRLAQEPAYLEALKRAGLSSIFLQFDGCDDRIYRRMRGRDLLAQKSEVIRRCAGLEIGVVLVPLLVPGVNDQNIGDILRFALERIPTVRGVHFQPVSYFGRYPAAGDLPRITLPEVIRGIESQSDGLVEAASFKPSGCENALCSFHGNFIQMPDGSLHALTHHQTDCCQLPLEDAARGAAQSRRFVSLKWSGISSQQVENSPQSRYSLGEWEVLAERARTHAFSISGMAFQDVWTLDLERLRDCCIHIVAPDGRLIPFCAYNLTAADGRSLYRQAALETCREMHST